MKEYFWGFIKNLCNRKVSFFSLIDKNTTISEFARVKPFAKVICSPINCYSYIGRGSALYHTKIGKFCSIGMDCKIGLPSHTLSRISTSPIFTEKDNDTGTSWTNNDFVNPYEGVSIGNDVWIGDNCLIRGGVKISNGSVLGTGAVVTKDVPPYAIVAGAPAKIIRFRFSEEIICLLEKSKWWELEPKKIKGLIEYFQKDNLSAADIDTFIKITSKLK